MDNSGESNIFDLLGKKKEPPKKTAPPPVPRESHSGLDTSSMMKRMRELHQDLMKKVEIVSAKNKAEYNVKEYGLLYAKEAWDQMEKEKEKLENDTWAALGQSAKVKKQKKAETKATKSRKAKTGGDRRKWISMR